MIKLLIADDHVVMRQALCETLKNKKNFEVIGQAANGEQLLELLKSARPDVIIMDLSMPKVDGIAALNTIRTELNDKIPVLILSADEAEGKIKAALKAGATGYIPKNAAIEELEFAIESILEGKTYLSPSITSTLMSGGKVNVDTGSIASVLTKREIEILTHLADGKPNRVIGKLLHISTRTVDTHRSNILKKLNVKTNAELVKIAITNRLITV
jgi:DNA-binding NarL/FixJ family response regulator